MKPCRGCGGEKSGRSPYCDGCREQRQPLSLRADQKRQQPEYAQVLLLSPRQYGKNAFGPPIEVWPEGQAWCRICTTFRPRTDFTKRATKKGLAPVCRPCESNQRFVAHLATKFDGMTVAEYDALFLYQEGRCAICGTKPKSKRLAVDHDHKTGAKRGLLCKRCNHDLLGAAHDSVELLETAIRYLREPPASRALGGRTRYVRRRRSATRTLLR